MEAKGGRPADGEDTTIEETGGGGNLRKERAAEMAAVSKLTGGSWEASSDVGFGDTVDERVSTGAYDIAGQYSARGD